MSVILQDEAYYARTTVIPSDKVRGFVEAITCPPISGIQLENLGLASAELDRIARLGLKQLELNEAHSNSDQEARFLSAFKSEETVMQALRIAMIPRFDDFPAVSIAIVLITGKQLRVASKSPYYFMLPWVITAEGGNQTQSYNANISRTLQSVLPPAFTNRERLSGSDIAAGITSYVIKYKRANTFKCRFKISDVDRHGQGQSSAPRKTSGIIFVLLNSGEQGSGCSRIPS